jgi:hypothetical protein
VPPLEVCHLGKSLIIVVRPLLSSEDRLERTGDLQVRGRLCLSQPLGMVIVDPPVAWSIPENEALLVLEVDARK